MFLQRICKYKKQLNLSVAENWRKEIWKIFGPSDWNKKINLKETLWRKNKFEKFLERKKQFEEHKFKKISDSQKQTVSNEEDKFETSMFLTRQKQVEENKFEKFLTRQKQESEFKTLMFLTSGAVWK